MKTVAMVECTRSVFLTERDVSWSWTIAQLKGLFSIICQISVKEKTQLSI